MADIVLYTSPYYYGRTVRARIAGYDCGNYVVAIDGTITVPYQSDPDAAMTAAALKTLADTWAAYPFTFGITKTTVTVTISAVAYNLVLPVQVGFVYTSQGKQLRPQTENDLKNRTGPGLGMTRRMHMYSVLLSDATTNSYSFGTSFTTLTAALFKDNGNTALAQTTEFNGVHWDTVTDSYSFDAQLCWQNATCFGGDILMTTTFLETAER